MPSDISFEKTKVSSNAKTLAALLFSVFTAGAGYADLKSDVNGLKGKQTANELREERGSERDSANAVHLQRVDDALEHLKDSVDRIDKNVQELRRR